MREQSGIELFSNRIVPVSDQMTFHPLGECGRFGIALWPF